MMRMTLIIVGLGNPGKEYETTRHNAGRSAVTLVAKQEGFDEFVFNKTSNALVSKGAIGGENTTLVLPETMMNNSGKAVAAVLKASGRRNPPAGGIFWSFTTTSICRSAR